MPYEPDVAFGLHPALGAVAAVRDGLPHAEAALRAAGFAHRTDLDIFVLPDSADRRSVVRLVRDLQSVGYTVAADPQLVAPPPDATIPTLTTRIAEARRPSDIAHVFDDLLHGRDGALPQLQQLLETAAAWCEEHLGPQGTGLMRDCQDLARRITDLTEDLGFTGGDLLDLDTPLPPRATTATAADQTHRAHVATAASPALRSTSPPPTADPPQPHRPSPGAGPGTAHTRRR
ncbi:hypothetical protein RKE29_01505 [Streptomyces sp. B1866]|uniref:hypothetical protein n=1 Tax=Streptomyces sp. B1866 TaxID=3075431 RepID=UPI002891B28A|nr:hypothetical protein [Streptomyces sp. B1866]MDT3395336.1 hypothetical protein [Streptomyces sp. B1866]